MFHPTRFENSQPDGFPVLEIEEAERKTERRRFIPLRKTILTGEVLGPLATLHLTQTFLFTKKQFGKPVEALYRFPLPGDAAVTRVAVQFGETRIEANLAEREKAEAEYAEAKQQGRQAALTTRESPDVFTLRLAGIRPDEEVIVETVYVQYARPESGARWSLRVPLTTAPRYVRADEEGSRAANGQPLALMRDPGHRFSLDLSLPGSGDVRSDTHTLDIVREEASEELDAATSRVRLAAGEVIPDRDFVLTWRADNGGAEAPQPEPARLQVWRQDEKGNGADSGFAYFLAQITPPRWRGPRTDAGVGREVILLVDHSGSMEGAKWAAADWAVTRFLSDLTEKDTFALGLFHNTTRWFDEKPSISTPDTVEKAIRFLNAHKDSGGTELGVALEQALSLSKDSSERARHVLIVTDAEVSDAGRILRLAEAEAAIEDPWKRRRLSVLCIDAAPNSLLATELAERGGGIARFLTSDPAQEDITTALDALLEDWAEPVYAHMRLVVDQPGGESSAGMTPVEAASDSSSTANKTAFPLGDLPGGRTVTMIGRVPLTETTSDTLTFRATLSNGTEITPAVRRTVSSNHEGLPALFGARRVLGLERLMASGYGPDDLRQRLERLGYGPDAITQSNASNESSLYPENRPAVSADTLKPLLVQESLRYGILSAETAFIATRREAGELVAQTVVIANALPSGWNDNEMDYMMAAPAADMAFGRSQARVRSLAQPVSAPPPPSPLSAKPASSSFFPSISAFLKKSKSASPGTVYEASEPEFDKSVGAPSVFEGVPMFAGGSTAVLYDSDASGAASLISAGTLTRLEVKYPNGAPSPSAIGQNLTLLLYVDDLATPRARVRLSDLLKQGGGRPLNLLRGSGQRVYLVLSDEDGVWSGGNAPELIVTLS
jgi:Ca-activated chloride channel family protein